MTMVLYYMTIVLLSIYFYFFLDYGQLLFYTLFIQIKGSKIMNERIKNLRIALHLSQAELGKRLGVTGTAISRMEIGNRNITEQMILAICREFNVREEWLRTGNGEMFLDFTEDEFSKAAATLSNDSFVRSLLVEYCKLDDESKKLFQNFINKLSDNMRGQ